MLSPEWALDPKSSTDRCRARQALQHPPRARGNTMSCAQGKTLLSASRDRLLGNKR